MALLLGRRGEDMDEVVMAKIDGHVIREIVEWWRKRKELLGWD